MDESEFRNLENEHTPLKGATMGLAAGTFCGSVVAGWYDVPHLEGKEALIRTLKVSGNYGLTLAAIGGICIGVEQLLEEHRMKRDFINGAVGAFVAGASVLGFKGRSISTAITSGSALALSSAVTSALVHRCLKDKESEHG